jgi:hypothetical protein
MYGGIADVGGWAVAEVDGDGEGVQREEVDWIRFGGRGGGVLRRHLLAIRSLIDGLQGSFDSKMAKKPVVVIDDDAVEEIKLLQICFR